MLNNLPSSPTTTLSLEHYRCEKKPSMTNEIVGFGFLNDF
jgi:hypothetical protein